MLEIMAFSFLGGLVLGVLLHRSAMRQEPIYGGLPAQFFHYLASATMCSLFPTIFITVILGHSLIETFLSGLAFLGTTLILLGIFGFFENMAERPVETTPKRMLD